MESIKRSALWCLFRRIKNLPMSLWMNKNIGDFTFIDRRYITISDGGHVSIGNQCRICAGIRIETIEVYAGQKFNPRISIGDNVCINQNFHCTCASSVTIGSGTSITTNCGVFDIVHPYDDIYTNPREQAIKVKPVVIGENCLIGMNSVILPGAQLGRHVIIGANSTVPEGVYESYSVFVGSPAKMIKKYDFQQEQWRKTNHEGNFVD